MIEYVILVGLVIALVKVIRVINKPDENLPEKYFNESFLPLIAIVIGMSLNVVSNLPGSDVALNGMIAALAAMGLYDSGKSAVVITKEVLKKDE